MPDGPLGDHSALIKGGRSRGLYIFQTFRKPGLLSKQSLFLKSQSNIRIKHHGKVILSKVENISTKQYLTTIPRENKKKY